MVSDPPPMDALHVGKYLPVDAGHRQVLAAGKYPPVS